MREKNLLNNKSLFKVAMLTNIYFFSVHFLQYLSYFGIVLLVVWGIAILAYDIYYKKIKKVYLYKFSLAFLVIGVVSHILNIAPDENSYFSTLVGIVLLVITAIFMYIFIPSNREKKGRIAKEIYTVGKIYLYTTFILNIIGIILLVVFKGSLGERIIIYDNRFTGVYINPNMGAFNCFLTIVFAGFLTSTKFCKNIGKARVNKIFANIAMAISYLVIAISDSKGALLVLVAFLLVFCGLSLYKAYVAKKMRHMKYAVLGIVMTAVVVFTVKPCQNAMAYVVNNVDITPFEISASAETEKVNNEKENEAEITFDHEAEKEKNGGGRLNLYLKSIEFFKEKPVFGWGAGNMLLMGEETTVNTIDNLQIDLGSKIFEAHNGYLTILATSGIVGFVVFVALIGIALYVIMQNTLFKVKNGGIGKTAIITAAIIAFLVYAFVEPSLVYYPCASVATLWFFLGAGLQSVANNKNLKLNSSVKELVGFKEPSEFDD